MAALRALHSGLSWKEHLHKDGLDQFTATASWCGQWDDRQAAGGITCAESIFDAKGLLFLTIIGGALAIIFFQCSIMAVVAATSGSKKAGDAKP